MNLDGKSKNYGELFNPHILDLIPPGNHKILDVGCAQGVLLQKLKESGKASLTIGIELSSEAAEKARTRVDRVLCGDIETMDLSVHQGSCDYIIYADLIEHLRDPWAMVAKHKTLLKKSGRMIFCVPNVRNFFVITQLIRGFWNYTNRGILDNTHLRFFTLRNILRQFERLELKIETQFGLTPDSAWYRDTNENRDLDENILKLFDTIREKCRKGEDCSKELTAVFGNFKFNPEDTVELITAQFIFSVSLHK
ncbi:MAG: class I SAM-dependent methyltransferase [Desulfobacteraceae bacterium]|nr:MAG: class I SAM-dependent methyltransferase [Desulfobacteraceae bacterium]